MTKEEKIKEIINKINDWDEEPRMLRFISLERTLDFHEELIEDLNELKGTGD